MPFCLCLVVPKLNGEVAPSPVDVEGVTEVNTNWDDLEPVVSFVVVVPKVFGELKENIGLPVAGAGMDGVVAVVVENALTGADVVPKRNPFLCGLGSGFEVSCLSVANKKAPGEVPVATAVFKVEGGKATFRSVPPTGLFQPKLKGDLEGCDDAG